MGIASWNAAVAAAVAGFLGLAVNDSMAGGFAIREQSTIGLGSAFAGIAAGGALSSMYWNPATMTQLPGMRGESSYTGILPSATHSYSASGLAIAPPYANSGGDSGRAGLVAASYSSWQINDRLWLGLAVNAPFGLSVGFPRTWAGAAYGQNSDVRSYNFNPNVAYRVNNWLSFGVGVQAQYLEATYDALIFPPTAAIGEIKGNGWGWGWTAGVTITPTPNTEIGVGYRSSIDQDLTTTLVLPVGFPASTPGSTQTTIKLPDTLTFGLRHKLTDRFTFLLGAEWSNWSRIGTSTLQQLNGGAALVGGGPVRIPFEYSDGWFVSIGGEYKVDPQLTLRGGFGFEKSPITDSVRTPRLPDNDRYWFSVGASYQHPQFRALTFDLAYSFIDVVDTPINVVAGNPSFNPAFGPYVGSVNANVHLISFGIHYKVDELWKMLSRG